MRGKEDSYSMLSLTGAAEFISMVLVCVSMVYVLFVIEVVEEKFAGGKQ